MLMAAMAVFIPASAVAKTFTNAYVSFELTDKWDCKPEQTEWICRTKDPGLAEAIIVLTAKEVGPQDNLQAYEAHLKTPRQIVTRSGQNIKSTVYTIQQRTIANHPWVDGMHFSSEVSNYYTRYVGTIKERIAVLVTFSAHRAHYTKYSADFFKAVDSLRVVASRSLMNASSTNLPGTGNMYGAGGDAGAGGLMPSEPDGTAGHLEGGGLFGVDSTGTLLGGLILLGAIGFYILKKKRQANESDDD
jgi:LPXTG-motif cell wall-anchored protein